MTKFKKIEALLKDAIAYDHTFDQNYSIMECGMLVNNLYFDNKLIYYICDCAEQRKIDIDSISKITINVISEHFNYDGTPILVLDVGLDERQLHFIYIYR